MGRAIEYRRFGGPEVLEEVDRPEQAPDDGEVRIAVRAVGLNPITELVRFRHLDPRWIDDANPLDTISDEELCYELMRRMRNHAFMSGDVG